VSLTQSQANELCQALKRAIRESPFEWNESKRADEQFIAVELHGVEFILSLVRSPFEIRLHLRTKGTNIGLCRIDGNLYHANPDGEEVRSPHIHWYREGHDLDFAAPIDWYDTTNPQATLERFLNEVNASFPSGHQLTIF
jgi:hypothetical protein